jgi:hypothetical protein
LDEEMAHEVQTHLQGRGAGGRAQEWRQPEPAGEDQPEVSWIPGGTRNGRAGGAPGELTADDVEARSRLGRYLALSALPGNREDLLAVAEENQAPDDVLAELRRLPADETYATVNEVWAALGHTNETHRW